MQSLKPRNKKPANQDQDKSESFLEAAVGALAFVCFFFGLLMIEACIFQPYTSVAWG